MGFMLEGDILVGYGGIIVVMINYRLGIYGELGCFKFLIWVLNVKLKEFFNFFFLFLLVLFVIFCF